MYVIEKEINGKTVCEWIKDAKEDIQDRLYQYGEEGFSGLTPFWTCYELEEPDDPENEYQQAIFKAEKEFVDAGNALPAYVVAFPGRVPENTYQVWTVEESNDLKNWEELMDEWAAFSNDYVIRPYYVPDDKIGSEWLNADDAQTAAAIAEAADLKPFVTRDKEAGNVIDEFQTIEDAREAIEGYEMDDEQEGTFTPNFYEIYNVLKQEIVE